MCIQIPHLEPLAVSRLIQSRRLLSRIHITVASRSGRFLSTDSSCNNNKVDELFKVEEAESVNIPRPPTEKFLVPGGNGFVGSHICKEALDRDLSIASLRRESKLLENESHPISTFKVNYDSQPWILIRVLCLQGKLGEAISLWNGMIHNNVIPDVITHNHLINGFCKFGDLEKAKWLFNEMLDKGPSPNCVTYNTLINYYCKSNNFDAALDLFNMMIINNVNPNRATCNILVHGFSKSDVLDLEIARELLAKTLDETCGSNASRLMTSTMLMDDCFKKGDVVQAIRIWNEISQNGYKDIVAYNVLISGLSRNRCFTSVYRYLSEMFKSGCVPDIFTYNPLLSIVCGEGKSEEACYIHAVMLKMGVHPDQLSYKVLIRGLCQNGAVGKANEVLEYMLRNSIVPDPIIWNMIIEWYGRCGNLQQALSIKDQMTKHGISPNIFTYNALIYAYISHGEIQKADSLRKEMVLNRIFPDVVTYNLFINAACKTGGIHDGILLHDEMFRDGCSPDIITYTNLLKAYCIEGRVKEAEEIFERIIIHTGRNGFKIDQVPFQILLKMHWRMGNLDRVYGIYHLWLRMDK